MMSDEEWMGVALAEADLAVGEGEIPVGCVIVAGSGLELGRGHNLREQLNDVSAHAEVVTLRLAAKSSGSWRCAGSTAYVTLEPCVMCAGAFVQAHVGRVVYGCDDPKGGGAFSLYTIGADPRMNHRFELVRGVLAEPASARLQAFFRRLRRNGKK